MCIKPLRAHHGMCLSYFSGHGYSSAFVAHMGQVLASLQPDTPVRLSTETDLICAACPHNHDGVCEQAAQVAAYDRAVLERCGLHAGQTLPFRVFLHRVRTAILEPGRREEICGDCRWNALCQPPV